MSTHIFLLLDMTGSMSSKKEATIDACNEYIGGQQSNGLGDARCSHWGSSIRTSVWNGS